MALASNAKSELLALAAGRILYIVSTVIETKRPKYLQGLEDAHICPSHNHIEACNASCSRFKSGVGDGDLPGTRNWIMEVAQPIADGVRRGRRYVRIILSLVGID